MSDMGSVSFWVDRLKAGDAAAAQPLWEGYFARLIGLARAKLRGTPRRAADEEDVALSAFDSFCRAAAGGRFPRLDDRDDLWQILLMLTSRKAVNLVQHERRAKRGGNRVIPASALAQGDSTGPGPLNVEGAEPDPAEAALLAEECQHLLDLLADEQLRAVALWKMEGYRNDEIALKINRSVASVERKLKRIREQWQHAHG